MGDRAPDRDTAPPDRDERGQRDDASAWRVALQSAEATSHLVARGRVVC